MEDNEIIDQVCKFLEEMQNMDTMPEKDMSFTFSKKNANSIKLDTTSGFHYLIKYNSRGNEYSQGEPTLTVFDENMDLQSYTTEWGDEAEICSLIDNLEGINADYDEEMGESTKVAKAIKLLKESNYILKEDANAPATKKQLWALFCIYHKDFRDQNLTMGEASEMIKKAHADNPKVAVKDIETKIREDIETNLVPAIENKMEKCFSQVGAVVDGNGKRYKFFGNGCGFATIDYDHRNKKLGEWITKYTSIYHKEYEDDLGDKIFAKYHEQDMRGCLYQDIEIQKLIQRCAIDGARRNGINTDSVKIRSWLD